MEYIDMMIKQIIDNFDFAFMFIINVLVYIVIKIVDTINGIKEVTVWQKRTILVVCIILISIFYRWSDYNNDIRLLNSAILAPVFYTWILRPILIKLDLGYKDYDDTFK